MDFDDLCFAPFFSSSVVGVGVAAGVALSEGELKLMCCLAVLVMGVGWELTSFCLLALSFFLGTLFLFFFLASSGGVSPTTELVTTCCPSPLPVTCLRCPYTTDWTVSRGRDTRSFENEEWDMELLFSFIPSIGGGKPTVVTPALTASPFSPSVEFMEEYREFVL